MKNLWSIAVASPQSSTCLRVSACSSIVGTHVSILCFFGPWPAHVRLRPRILLPLIAFPIFLSACLVRCLLVRSKIAPQLARPAADAQSHWVLRCGSCKSFHTMLWQSGQAPGLELRVGPRALRATQGARCSSEWMAIRQADRQTPT